VSKISQATGVKYFLTAFIKTLCHCTSQRGNTWTLLQTPDCSIHKSDLYFEIIPEAQKALEKEITMGVPVSDPVLVTSQIL